MINLMNSVIKPSIAPAVYEGDEDGTSCDMNGTSGPVFMTIQAVVTLADVPITFTVEESANGSTGWTSVPVSIQTLVQGVDVVRVVQFNRTKRYLRARFTAGPSLSANLAVLFISQLLDTTAPTLLDVTTTTPIDAVTGTYSFRVSRAMINGIRLIASTGTVATYRPRAGVTGLTIPAGDLGATFTADIPKGDLLNGTDFEVNCTTAGDLTIIIY